MGDNYRAIDRATLESAAKYYAGRFTSDQAPYDRDWVIGQFYKVTYKDEFRILVEAIKGELGPKAVEDFEARALEVFTPRSDKVFHKLLADKLALNPFGEHIPGKIGSTQVGQRVVGRAVSPIGKLLTWFWPIYAGEIEERIAESGVADPLPPGVEPLPVGAFNTRISNATAIAACNATVQSLDGGSSNAVVTGRTGTQPADPDTPATGTLLFTCACSDPAFAGAVDQNPGATATANAISDDASADATGTVGYCRGSTTNNGTTPVSDIIDGEAGTSGSDFNFNTTSIVAGATVSITSWKITMPES